MRRQIGLEPMIFNDQRQWGSTGARWQGGGPANGGSTQVGDLSQDPLCGRANIAIPPKRLDRFNVRPSAGTLFGQNNCYGVADQLPYEFRRALSALTLIF